VRDVALCGVWGREVHVTDGHRKYVRAPGADNMPLAMWSNRWSTMPIHALPDVRLPAPDERAALDRMPGSDIPVIRQPYAAGDRLPFWAGHRPDAPPRPHLLYDIDEDPAETHDLTCTAVEREMLDLMHHALASVHAPAEQFARLGLR
jgi:hypothetical protein